VDAVDRDRTTSLLARSASGEADAAEPLRAEVYRSLRAMAGAYDEHTLQPTALVHEAYVRLIDRARSSIESENHFVALAATAMRQILVDHARAKGAIKRGGDRQRITLSGLRADAGTEVDLIDLDEALSRLHERSERQARVVELRFFGGLSVERCAHVLGVSERTIEADWRVARAWLHAVLVKGADV